MAKWGHLFDENINGRHINACMIKCTTFMWKMTQQKYSISSDFYEKIIPQVSNKYQED